MYQSAIFLMLLGFPYNLNNLNPLITSISRRDLFKGSSLLATINPTINPTINTTINPIINPTITPTLNIKNKNPIKDDQSEEASFVGSISELNQRNQIYFYSDLTDQSVFKLNTNILYLANTLPPNGERDIHIQSGGGSLLPSLSTVDLIRTTDLPINTYIEGYAASAATLISVVASKRFITKNSVMLIHQLKMGTEYSKYNEIEDYFNNAETLMEIVKNIYLENTHLEQNLLSELLSKDLWLNSSFCKSNGLVDIII